MRIQETLGFRLVSIVKLKWRMLDTKLKKLGLSRTEWRALLWMKILGPCSQQELLEGLDIDAAHLTRILTKLEKEKLIIRQSVTGDRRSLQVSLSLSAEQKLIPSIESSIKEENEIMLNGINGEERVELMRLLEKVESNLLAFIRDK
jgi:MarR family transcriptional regulator for hemolysin